MLFDLSRPAPPTGRRSISLSDRWTTQSDSPYQIHSFCRTVCGIRSKVVICVAVGPGRGRGLGTRREHLPGPSAGVCGSGGGRHSPRSLFTKKDRPSSFSLTSMTGGHRKQGSGTVNNCGLLFTGLAFQMSVGGTRRRSDRPP